MDLKIFSFQPRKVELDNGQTVYLRRLSAADRVLWFEYLSKEEQGSELSASLDNSAWLMCRSVCDEQGQRLLTDDQKDAIKEIDSVTLDLLVNEAMAINAIGKANEDELKKK